MTALVSVEELSDRLPFEMDSDEEREATGALDDLSDDARYYGSESWETPETAPHQVKNLILKAAVRHMKNYEGYTQSRAGDETVGWTDRGHESGSAYFTESEQKRLAAYANRSTLHSVSVSSWGTKTPPEGFVPVDDAVYDAAGNRISGGKPFPLYTSDTSPW